MREAAIAAVEGERDYQLNKWGPKDATKNSIGDFLTYLSDYLGQAQYQLTRHENGRELALHTIRKITALGLAAMEAHGARTRAQEDAAERDDTPPSFNDILKAAMAGEGVDHLNPNNAAFGGPVPKEDPAGASTLETIYPTAKAVRDGELSDLPKELQDILQNVFANLEPGRGVKVIFHGPIA